MISLKMIGKEKDVRLTKKWPHFPMMGPVVPTILFLCMLVTIGWCFATNGHTHPLGNFSINLYSRLVPEAGSLSVFYVVDIAEIPSLQEKGAIDTDQDGQISDREKKRYLERKAAELPQGLNVFVNNQPVQLEVRSKEIIVTSEKLVLPTLRIELELVSPLPVASGDTPLEIIYEDNNYSDRLGWKEIIARAGSKVNIIESSVPETDVSNALRSYPEDLLNKPPDVAQARFTVVPGTGSAVSSDDRPVATAAPSREDSFTRLIKTKELTPRIYLIALLISSGLGAMHALSPGHGKSIVAAYLIGTRGTANHAVFLGATVTLTHTFGVFALGLITLFASRYILSENLYPWLSLGSGIIVVVIGAVMLVKRIQAARDPHRLDHHHIHGHDHHDHHDHGDHSHNSSDRNHHDHSHPHEDAHSPHAHHHHHDHDHDHHNHSEESCNPSTHHHDHTGHHHGNPSDRPNQGQRKVTLFHQHDHDHNHDHDHSHLPPGADGTPVTWRSLLALGITGGILPCPSALVVLLAAISLQRVGFGMVLIFAFSIGLAAVLTTVGLLFVKARQLLDRVPTAGPLMKILPAGSALVIMILGIGITVNALAQM
jgi:ABC-type nickel/cobalt efflux system permease component RcnA